MPTEYFLSRPTENQICVINGVQLRKIHYLGSGFWDWTRSVCCAIVTDWTSWVFEAENRPGPERPTQTSPPTTVVGVAALCSESASAFARPGCSVSHPTADTRSTGSRRGPNAPPCGTADPCPASTTTPLASCEARFTVLVSKIEFLVFSFVKLDEKYGNLARFLVSHGFYFQICIISHFHTPCYIFHLVLASRVFFFRDTCLSFAPTVYPSMVRSDMHQFMMNGR
jgi:hypothetical protein